VSTVQNPYAMITYKTKQDTCAFQKEVM